MSLQVVGAQDLSKLTAIDNDDGEGSRYITDGSVAMTWMKLGVDETDQIVGVLERLGPELLQHVKVIRKTQGIQPADDAVNHGQIASINHDANTGTLTYIEPLGFHYSDLNEKARHERSFLLAVGVAKSIWETLDVPTRRTWAALRRAVQQVDRPALRQKLQSVESEAEFFAESVDAIVPRSSERGPHASNYVSQMGMDSDVADFCAHFACYALCHDEFRTATESNRVIADKFKEIQNVIDGICGEKRGFSEGSMPVAWMEGGLRYQLPSMPNMHNAEDVTAWMEEQKDREELEKTEAYMAGDEEHDPDEAFQSDEERDLERDKTEALKPIADSILTALDTDEDGFEHLGELSEEIYSITLNAETGEIFDMVSAYLEETILLQELDADVAEDILHELEEEGVISSE